MELLTIEVKEKVEKYLKEYEGAYNIIWGDDYCTTFDKDGIGIDDYIIEVEDGYIYYTSVEYNQVTLEIE